MWVDVDHLGYMLFITFIDPIDFLECSVRTNAAPHMDSHGVNGITVTLQDKQYQDQKHI